jgi:hypothetical protein
MPFDMYGDVILTRDVRQHGLQARDAGTIVERHVVPGARKLFGRVLRHDGQHRGRRGAAREHASPADSGRPTRSAGAFGLADRRVSASLRGYVNRLATLRSGCTSHTPKRSFADPVPPRPKNRHTEPDRTRVPGSGTRPPRPSPRDTAMWDRRTRRLLLRKIRVLSCTVESTA